MNEPLYMLEILHEELSKIESEIVGSLVLSEDSLTALDGKIKLQAVVYNNPDINPAVAHCHVIAEIAQEHNGHLDACLIGINEQRSEALADAVRYWVEMVAGPIFSLMHGRPVLHSIQFDGTQIDGVAGCHGFAGPICGQVFTEPYDLHELDDLPMFDFANEMASPGNVHIAKVSLEACGEEGWNRNIEIDGHIGTHLDTPWSIAPPAPPQGVVSQFAVFHFDGKPDLVEQRRQVDDGIRRFVEAFKTTGDTYEAGDQIVKEGVSTDIADRIATFTPIALSRVLLASLEVRFPPTYIRIKRNGTTLTDLQLMHEPVYARSKILCQEFLENEQLYEAVKGIALSDSTVGTINNALQDGCKLADLELLPTIVPDQGVTNEMIQTAIDRLLEDIETESPPPSDDDTPPTSDNI